MHGLLKFFIWLWRVPDDEINITPDYIVVHSYGLRTPHFLPNVEIKVLEETDKFAHRFPMAKIIMASSDYFWSGCVSHENSLKISLLRSLGIPKSRIMLLGGVANTIEEIEKVRFFAKGRRRSILSIADQMHARSVRIMFSTIFPQARVAIYSVKCDWDDPESPLVYGRSNWRWLVANIVRHVGYLFFGKWIATFRHPLKKD